GNRSVVGNGSQHDRAGSHLGAMTDLDLAEDLGTRPDQDAAPDLRMPVAARLAGSAQRHIVQDRDIVLDDSRLAAREAGRMIEEDALADAGGRIDVGLEYRRRTALQIERKILADLLPQPVRQAVRLDRMKALE